MTSHAQPCFHPCATAVSTGPCYTVTDITELSCAWPYRMALPYDDAQMAGVQATFVAIAPAARAYEAARLEYDAVRYHSM